MYVKSDKLNVKGKKKGGDENWRLIISVLRNRGPNVWGVIGIKNIFLGV